MRLVTAGGAANVAALVIMCTAQACGSFGASRAERTPEKDAGARDAATEPEASFGDAPVTTAQDAGAPTWVGEALDSNEVQTIGVTGGDGIYLAVISTKEPREVTDVKGLGLAWTFVRAQCGSRNQTRVDLWIGKGDPVVQGAVVATFGGSPANAVMTVSRYEGVRRLGADASSNVLGPGGGCGAGSDTATPALTLVPSEGGRLFGAIAVRAQTFTPEPGVREIRELHAGSEGEAAGLAIVETAGTAITGTLDRPTDWAIVAVELLP